MKNGNYIEKYNKLKNNKKEKYSPTILNSVSIPKWLFNDDTVKANEILLFLNNYDINNIKLLKLLIIKLNELISNIKNDNACKRLTISTLQNKINTINSKLIENKNNKKANNSNLYLNNSIKFKENNMLYDNILSFLENKKINMLSKTVINNMSDTIPEIKTEYKRGNYNTKLNIIDKIYKKKYNI